jgi:hypothetical protein
MDTFIIPSTLTCLDGICGVGVCVKPVETDSFAVPGAVVAHLNIVAEDGSFFDGRDLERMCFNEHEADKLLDLCARRTELLAKTYLPRTVTAVRITPEVSYIDSDGFAQVSFFLEGRAL